MRTIMNIGAMVKGKYMGLDYYGSVREQYVNGKEIYVVQLDTPMIIKRTKHAVLGIEIICIEISPLSSDTIERHVIYRAS